jgi:hypothetical protein
MSVSRAVLLDPGVIFGTALRKGSTNSDSIFVSRILLMLTLWDGPGPATSSLLLSRQEGFMAIEMKVVELDVAKNVL